MGARAPPVAASQVTPSQAIALIDDEVVPETELCGDDVAICETFDGDKISDAFDADNAMDLEATQPPILTPINLEDLRVALCQSPAFQWHIREISISGLVLQA